MAYLCKKEAWAKTGLMQREGLVYELCGDDVDLKLHRQVASYSIYARP